MAMVARAMDRDESTGNEFLARGGIRPAHREDQLGEIRSPTTVPAARLVTKLSEES